jgi:hypothetical protein
MMRQYTRTYIRTRICNVEEVWLNDNGRVQHYKQAIPDARFEPLFGSFSNPRLYRILSSPSQFSDDNDLNIIDAEVVESSPRPLQPRWQKFKQVARRWGKRLSSAWNAAWLELTRPD